MQNRTTLRQRIYEQLKADIMSCTLVPGQVVSEDQLSARFGASRTPIREALTSLVQDRLVEYFPNRGFMVAGISIADIQDIFEARIFFETGLFRLAVHHMSDADIDRLESECCVRNGNQPDRPPHQSLESNIKFHMMLARAARNQRLFWHYQTLMNEAQRLFHMDMLRHPDVYQGAHGHEKILQALRARDEAAGLLAIREALESARRRILEP